MRFFLFVLAAAMVSCGFKFERPLVPGDIRGTLLAQQAGEGAVVPAAGARVQLVGTTRSTIADADGAFLFKDVPFGIYTVRARYDRDGDGKPDNELQVPGARIDKKVVRDLTLKGAWDVGKRQLNAAGFLVGTVTRNGAPARGAAVVVSGLPPAKVNPEDGTYRLALYGGDWDPAVVYNPGDKARFQVKVKIAVRAETTLDFALTDADPGEGAVQGRILLGDEDKHGGILVSIVGPQGVVEETTTNEDGTFAVAAVPAGIYRLEARAAGFQPASYGAFAVGGAPLPPITLFPAPEVPDCDGDGTPDQGAQEGDPGDLDDDNDGVADLDEAPACICDPAGSTDANQNGVCDELDVPALSSRSLLFAPVPIVNDAAVDAEVTYTVTPDSNAVPPLTWECATTAGPAPSVDTSVENQILVTPSAIGRFALRCIATDAEGAQGQVVMIVRATRFTADAVDSFVTGTQSLQAAVDAAAIDTQFTAHDIHVTGDHTLTAPLELKGANVRLWGGWFNDFSDRVPALSPTRIALATPAGWVVRAQALSGWQGSLDGFAITAPSFPTGTIYAVLIAGTSTTPVTISNNVIDVGAAEPQFGEAFAVRCDRPCHVLGNTLLGGAGEFAGAVHIGANAVIAHNALFCGGGAICAGIRAEGFQASSAWVWANIFWMVGNVTEHRHGFVTRNNPYNLALFANAFIDSGTSAAPTFFYEDTTEIEPDDTSLTSLNAHASLKPVPANIEDAACVAGRDRAQATQGFTLPPGSLCSGGFTYPADTQHPSYQVYPDVEPYLRFDRDLNPRRNLFFGGSADIGPDELP
jgi:hypothetical protein